VILKDAVKRVKVALKDLLIGKTVLNLSSIKYTAFWQKDLKDTLMS
jgi:hypothetical protein